MNSNRILAALLATVAAVPVSHANALTFLLNLAAIFCAMLLWSKK